MSVNWQTRTFGPKAGLPGETPQTPRGEIRVPARPAMPRRDSYFATVDAAVDAHVITDALVEYWMKVAEVVPRYYKGDGGPDPLSGESAQTFAPDNGWDRIVCLLEACYGKVTTQLWAGTELPKHSDRVRVIAKFPQISMACGATGEGVTDTLQRSLAEAAEREPARAALAGLRQWRHFTVWVMEEEEAETLRPLHSLPNE